VGRFLRVCLVMLVATGIAAADPVQFSFVFPEVDGAAGTGFDDPVDGAQRRAAALAAGAVWSSYLTASFLGETITVSLEFDGTIPAGSLGTTNQLRFAGPGPNSAGMSTTASFSSTVSNHFFGVDNTPTPDITSRFNPAPLVGPWYYGTDGLGGGTKLDFMTNVLHEITHGLGFDSAYDATGTPVLSDGAGGTVQGTQYDTWVQIGTGGVSDTAPVTWFYSKNLTPAQRSVAMGGGNLYWFGTNATAANGGSKVKLEATIPVAMGTDVSHTDKLTFPNSLMRPTLPRGLVIHVPDAITLGMLADLQWTITSSAPEPGSLALIALGLGGLVVLRRRRRKTGSTS